jgi:DNA-binding MarR family transcriptional regulator
MFMEIFDQVPDLVSSPSSPRFTEPQGQYLAFIHTYTLLNRRPPAEADIQRFFEVSAPTIHKMIVTLERNGLLRRTPGKARSIQLLVPAEELPTLQPIKTSATRY